MKKIYSNVLLDNLQADVRQIILQATMLEHIPASQLQQSPLPGKWSIAQVLEHLNIYARYYINAIEKKLHFNTTTPPVYFSPGWLGNYFTGLMKPKENNTIVKKMKAPKNAEPIAQPDGKAMLQEFISHQHKLLNLLNNASTANISSIRIPTSLTKLIKLKLGDTFRFVIAHQQRHFVQIKDMLISIRTKNKNCIIQYEMNQ